MNEKGVMKTDRMNKFIGIKKSVEYVGDDVATKLSQICTVTGCGTTCFLYNIMEKWKFLESCLWKRKASKHISLNAIGVSCKRILKGLCQNVCYPGKEKESLTETMVPL